MLYMYSYMIFVMCSNIDVRGDMVSIICVNWESLFWGFISLAVLSRITHHENN